MSKHGQFLGAFASVLAVLFVTAAAFGEPVDDARLRAASSGSVDWLTYGHSYDNQRFSELDQINRETIGRLRPAWTFHTGVRGTFQTSPLVADGVMYLTTPRNHVVALDAPSCY